ncbi:MAG: peptide ABC transporter substrate-binding protein [Bdellovibrionales bacterium]|nr:peptide ABC transporter substrate-binding protein [Bdellovibrionales bacterium]
MKKQLKLVILIAVSLCANAASPPKLKILNVRVTSAPVSLDWNGQATLTEAPYVQNLQEGLYAYEYPSQRIAPAVAVGVKKSTDMKEYTFKIRDDAKWSDGRAVFAQDFVDSWMRLLSPQSTSIYVYYLFDILNAKEYNAGSMKAGEGVGIKATDDRTLVVKLKRPMQSWEVNTAFWPLFPVRKDQIEKYGNNWWRAGIMLSNGPYTFDSYETGKKIVFKRNPHYHRHQSNVDEIDFQVVVNHEEALKKFESGHFTFLVGLPNDQYKKLQKRKDFQWIEFRRINLFGLNLSKYPMTSKDFRFAVLHAIDRKKLIEGNSDLFKLSPTLIPRGLPGSEKDAFLPFDILKAKEYLKKSGIVSDKKFKLRLLTEIVEPFYSIGKKIQTQLQKNLGINVELAALQNQEYTTYMNLGDYNATLLSWTAKVLSPQDFLLPYSGDASQNRMHFENPFFDQWIYEGMKASSHTDRSNAYYQAQKVVCVDEAIISPLFTELRGVLVSPKVQNIYFNHMGIPILKDVRL